MRRRDVLWKATILLWTVEIFMMAGQNFIMNSRDFYDDNSLFYYEQSRFPWWQIKIFVITGRDFIMNGWDFRDDGSRFSWWQVEISVICWDLYECINASAKSRRVRGASYDPTLMGFFQICCHIFWTIYLGNSTLIFRLSWCAVQEGC